MSRLVLRGNGRSWELNVLSFSAPVVSTISTVQTRPMLQHFPVKVNQPAIDMTVIFSSEREFEDFQAFVRRHQVNLQRLDLGKGGLVTLWWPERGIRNWTGIINAFRAGGARRNYAPVAKVTVMLVESAIARYCVDDQTEILTRRGWLRHYQVRTGDETLGLREDGTVSWTSVEKVNVFPGQCEMIEWRSRHHDSLSTPNHRWLVQYAGHRHTGTRWTTSDQLGDKWLEAVVGARELTEYPEQKYSDALVELVGWYWTEGHLHHLRRTSPGISIAQSPSANPENWTSIQAALIACFGEAKAHGDGRAFYVGSKDGKAEQIYRHAPGKEKLLSLDFVLSLTKAQLKLFIDVSIRADGHERGRWGADHRRNICQKHRASLDVFQIACQLAGLQTSLSQHSDGKWWLSIYEKNLIYPARPRRSGKIRRRWHEGIVWCPSTVTGTWLARRNGKVYFTGNTDIYSFVASWRTIFGEGVPGGILNLFSPLWEALDRRDFGNTLGEVGTNNVLYGGMTDGIVNGSLGLPAEATQ